MLTVVCFWVLSLQTDPVAYRFANVANPVDDLGFLHRSLFAARSASSYAP